MSNAMQKPYSERTRHANYTFNCERCGAERSKYIRPSWGRPRFCSQSCKTAQQNSDRTWPSGPSHYAWQGDAVSAAGGRHRAQRAFVAVECAQCGARPAERHHRDGNTANNTAENIAILCRRCHMEADGRISEVAAQMRAIQPLGVAARWRR